MMVESLFQDWKKDTKFNSLISAEMASPFSDTDNFLKNKRTVLGVKPQTYMNFSGDAVAAIVSYYKIDPKTDLLVLSDDIDMLFGKVRFRLQGSHGGQNGLRDIIQKLGMSDFARIKVGIGRNDQFSVSDWVLSSWTQEERIFLETEVQKTVQQYVFQWLCD